MNFNNFTLLIQRIEIGNSGQRDYKDNIVISYHIFLKDALTLVFYSLTTFLVLFKSG